MAVAIFGPAAIPRFPFYYEAKALVIVWLTLPQIQVRPCQRLRLLADSDDWLTSWHVFLDRINARPSRDPPTSM